MDSQRQMICLHQGITSFSFDAPEMRRHHDQVRQLRAVERDLILLFPTKRFGKLRRTGRRVLVLNEHLVIDDLFQLTQMVAADSDFGDDAAFFQHTGIFFGQQQRKHGAKTVKRSVCDWQIGSGSDCPENGFIKDPTFNDDDKSRTLRNYFEDGRFYEGFMTSPDQISLMEEWIESYKQYLKEDDLKAVTAHYEKMKEKLSK